MNENTRQAIARVRETINQLQGTIGFKLPALDAHDEAIADLMDAIDLEADQEASQQSIQESVDGISALLSIGNVGEFIRYVFEIGNLVRDEAHRLNFEEVKIPWRARKLLNELEIQGVRLLETVGDLCTQMGLEELDAELWPTGDAD